MDACIVLAGGFYGISHKQEFWGYRTRELSDSNRGVDFIIKVKGLGEDFIKPEEMRKHYEWYCKKCDRVVPEWEMERKYGCAMHDPEPTMKVIPKWRIGVLEPYKLPVLGIETYRIGLDNGQGRQIWQDIVRYIKAKFPASKSLHPFTPVPVGTRTEFLLTLEDIPEIVLDNSDYAKTPKEEIELMKEKLREGLAEIQILKDSLNKKLVSEGKSPEMHQVKIYDCSICGAKLKSYLAHYNHMKRHKKKDELKVQERLSNVGSTSNNNADSSS